MRLLAMCIISYHVHGYFFLTYSLIVFSLHFIPIQFFMCNPLHNWNFKKLCLLKMVWFSFLLPRKTFSQFIFYQNFSPCNQLRFETLLEKFLQYKTHGFFKADAKSANTTSFIFSKWKCTWNAMNAN